MPQDMLLSKLGLCRNHEVYIRQNKKLGKNTPGNRSVCLFWKGGAVVYRKGRESARQDKKSLPYPFLQRQSVYRSGAKNRVSGDRLRNWGSSVRVPAHQTATAQIQCDVAGRQKLLLCRHHKRKTAESFSNSSTEKGACLRSVRQTHGLPRTSLRQTPFSRGNICRPVYGGQTNQVSLKKFAGNFPLLRVQNPSQNPMSILPPGPVPRSRSRYKAVPQKHPQSYCRITRQKNFGSKKSEKRNGPRVST